MGRKAIEIKNNKFVEPSEIKITYDSESKALSITDNGTGMSDHDVNNYVVGVGHSYYNSKQFLSEQLVQRCGNNDEYSARYFRQRKAEEGGDAGCIVD